MKPPRLAVLPLVALMGCTTQIEAWNEEFVGQPVGAFIRTDTLEPGVTVGDTTTYTVQVVSPVQPTSNCDRIVTVQNGIIQDIRSMCWYDNV